MNRNERRELAHWVIKQALKAGADEVSAYIANSRQVDCSYRDAKLEELTESTQNSLSLDLYINHKYSGHSTNDLRRDALTGFIEEATAMTKFLEPDEFRILTDPKYYQGRKDINLEKADPAHESITSDRRVEMARMAEDAAKSQSDKIVSCTGAYGDTYAEAFRVHSNGFEGESAGTSHYNYAEATVEDKNGGRPNGYYYGQCRYFEDLPTSQFCGEDAVRRALAKVGQKKLPSGRYDMLIENRTGGRLLSSLYSPMTARNISRKNSFLDGKLGQRIGSEKMTMIDDPFVIRGLGSRLFDGDGISAQRRVMIDKGILKSYYVDNYYGRKTGMEPTSGGSSNIVMEYGTKDLNEMIKGIKKGILVNSFLGGNSNATTGDFSFGIVGQYIEDGQLIHGVNEMNISGNLIDFWQQLVDVGKDANPYSSWRLPTLQFHDVECSGV